jgi:SRSO17 transposase
MAADRMARGDAEPIKYWLSTLAADISLDQLVNAAKLRWRIERDYHELKQELGLGHYEGRGWRGFHDHASLCSAAYGFLIAQRETIPPLSAGQNPKPLEICHFQKLSTPRLPQSDPSATSQIRSQPSEDA